MTLTAVLRSEWTKIRSLRSLHLSLAAILVATAGIGCLVCGSTDYTHEGPDFDPVFTAFFGLNFGQFAAVAFGVLTVAGEWSGGSIRVSLAAVPRRGLLYAGKLGCVGVLGLVVGLVTGFAALLGGQAFLGDMGVGPGAPGAVRAAVGCGLYLALLAVLSAGFAAVVRSPVGALSLLVPLFLSLFPMLGSLDATRKAGQFLPDRAGQQILHSTPDGVLGAWSGMAVMACWVALAAGAGWWSLSRRDV
ncbi:ABC transporter permease [Streptomyces piniterrae]|uniref:ABC transporter permease n=1 Tax=Streptomyces piniterrae TaxID=2571125 RepID=A0A4U0NWV5_9ACTN|nr:ABC transporter permease subunit [Streptomyces piniterrae]TJZ59265.1 ABC transporter permease [Streptomyces piniterrae]